MSNSENKKELAIETLLKPKMAKTKKEVIQIMENLTTGYDPENDPLDDVLFIKDRLTQLQDGCFSQKALSYSSEIVEGLGIGQIRYITARLNGASQEQIEAIRKENKKILNAKNNMRKALDFQKRNKDNVEFSFKIKTPRGESNSIDFIPYPSDFEELCKEHQVNPGQNEQFKITMEIEIKSTRRSANNYRDLMQHFLSRPPLRMSPVPDIVREVRNKQKELQQGISKIDKTTQNAERKLSNIVDKKCLDDQDLIDAIKSLFIDPTKPISHDTINRLKEHGFIKIGMTVFEVQQGYLRHEKNKKKRGPKPKE